MRRFCALSLATFLIAVLAVQPALSAPGWQLNPVVMEALNDGLDNDVANPVAVAATRVLEIVDHAFLSLDSSLENKTKTAIPHLYIVLCSFLL